MKIEQLPYYLAFNSLQRMSSRRALALLAQYNYDAAAAWQDGPDWPVLQGLGQASRQHIAKEWKAIEPDFLLQQVFRYRYSVAVWGDDDYPKLLKDIYDPPLLLTYQGRLPWDDEPCFAMVGSRDYSGYGRQVAEIFSRDLAQAGFTIVSGMARGIDSFCHNAALRCGGRTLAVLGSGLDIIYPRENRRLYEEICENGAVVSEFPMGTAPDSKNFPRRNRVISGISMGVLVVEAGLRSGTMRTVDCALEQGRDVFAVPGPVTSESSKGTNKLIQDCRNIMALSAEDVIRHYHNYPGMTFYPLGSASAHDGTEGLSETERILLAAMTLPVQFDDIPNITGVNMQPQELAALLTMLELRGLLKQLPGQYYQRVINAIR